ncbi:hypothetical protein LUZ60_006354 [Juncus effusus]|nr:hypothetical protein LUZ60_006354 [Juncus effusus]
METQPKRQHVSHNPHSPPSNNASSLEQLLESVLAVSDPSVPLDLSLERILESRALQSEKEKIINAALEIGSALIDAASRSARKLATAHNSIVWPLPPELTVKVLSCLDTTSLCYASATCTAFCKCASDPSCYANIDLTRNWPKVRNSVVCTMIQRAGKNLKSLKLGTKSRFDSEGHPSEPPLTRSCLVVLNLDNRAFGALLQKICLYGIHDMDKNSLISVLSSCESLKELEIFGININLDEILKAVSINCTSVERLWFDYSDFSHPPIPDGSGWKGLIKNCNNLTSISIIGCILYDWMLRELIKGLINLKYADFNSSIHLKGSFLRNLGNGNGGDCLETLILKDCPFLSTNAIGQFFNDVLAGEWKSLRFIDVTSDRWEFITCGFEVLEDFKERRPEIRVLAEFRDREYITYVEHMQPFLDAGTDASSSSGDELSQNGDYDDDQNSDDNDSSSYDDSSDDNEFSQNGEDQNSDSSSDDKVAQNGEIQVAQNGDDDQNIDDSSSDVEIALNGEESSDNEVH